MRVVVHILIAVVAWVGTAAASPSASQASYDLDETHTAIYGRTAGVGPRLSRLAAPRYKCTHRLRAGATIGNESLVSIAFSGATACSGGPVAMPTIRAYLNTPVGEFFGRPGDCASCQLTGSAGHGTAVRGLRADYEYVARVILPAGAVWLAMPPECRGVFSNRMVCLFERRLGS